MEWVIGRQGSAWPPCGLYKTYNLLLKDVRKIDKCFGGNIEGSMMEFVVLHQTEGAEEEPTIVEVMHYAPMLMKKSP